tara:strand:- start:363 stop:545 length:183 start_codon:yes stop_codon:yes gene_type:complete
MTYKLTGKHASDGPAEFAGKDINRIIRKSDGAQIPKDPKNTDYQLYLEWVAAGNTPEEAD